MAGRNRRPTIKTNNRKRSTTSSFMNPFDNRRRSGVVTGNAPDYSSLRDKGRVVSGKAPDYSSLSQSGRPTVEKDIFPELPKQKSKPKPKSFYDKASDIVEDTVKSIPKNVGRLGGRLGAAAGMLLSASTTEAPTLAESEWGAKRAKRSGSENKKVRRASTYSKSSSSKTGVKSGTAGTALSVGSAPKPSAVKDRSKASVSAIPAKNRAKSSASSGRKTSSKREDYLNMGSPKPVAKKASGSYKPAPSAMNRRENSLNMSKPKSSVKKKMRDSVLRGTSRTPDSERAVKTVKTKGGDYKVYRKDSAAAKSFRQAFADARKTGKKVFTWNGKKYSTAVK